MSEAIITKCCSKCKQVKPISEFYKNKAKKDGYQCSCKICKEVVNRKYARTEKGKQSQKRHFQTEKGKQTKRRYKQTKKSKEAQKRYIQSKKGRVSREKYYYKNKFKVQARSSVSYAVKTGKLPRPDFLQCSCCPKQAQEYHHYLGYVPEHWLDVVSVCTKCHTILDTQLLEAIK